MAGTLKLQSAVQCEDVRIELNGRHTLVGVQAGTTIQTSGPQGYLKRLGLWALFSHSDKEPTNSKKIQLRMTCAKHDREHVKAEVSLKLDQFREAYVLVVNFPMSPITHDGMFSFEWSEDNENWSPLMEVQNIVQGQSNKKTTTPSS